MKLQKIIKIKLLEKNYINKIMKNLIKLKKI